jgi:hypothetical protein
VGTYRGTWEVKDLQLVEILSDLVHNSVTVLVGGERSQDTYPANQCRRLSTVTLVFKEILCSNDAMNASLRREVGREEFDYSALMAALSGYAKPHQKITSLLRRGVIVRVKKGLYVFGEGYRQRPYSRELLANLIYGPSFISLDYALSYHGLIPERVEQVTSVTTGRARKFDTPVGTFLYRPVPRASFHVGMNRVETRNSSFLIASSERALADKVREDRATRLRSLGDAETYLFSDLRVDMAAFLEMDLGSFREIAEALGSRKALFCADLLQKMRR